MRIRPLNIRFAHDSVSHKFSCGRRLDDTLDELWYGRIQVTDIPQMIVVRIGDLWFAYTGNRRLWVFQTLEELGKLHTIDVHVTHEEIPRRRLTTKNMGVSIRVRGFLRPLPQPEAYSSSSTSTAESYSFWASLSDHRVQQSLLDSLDDFSFDCLALNMDESGYFLRRQDGSWKYRNMPSAFCDAFTAQQDQNDNDPVLVACGCSGRYFILFDDGVQSWSGSRSESFTRATREGPAVEAVAFSPDCGYWLRRSDGSTKWLRLPSSLDDCLEESETEAEYVAISPAGGWFVRFSDGSWEYDDIPLGCHQRIKGQEKKGQVLVQLTFGAGDDWVAVFQ